MGEWIETSPLRMPSRSIVSMVKVSDFCEYIFRTPRKRQTLETKHRVASGMDAHQAMVKNRSASHKRVPVCEDTAAGRDTKRGRRVMQRTPSIVKHTTSSVAELYPRRHNRNVPKQRFWETNRSHQSCVLLQVRDVLLSSEWGTLRGLGTTEMETSMLTVPSS